MSTRNSAAVLKALEIACMAHPTQRVLQVLTNALDLDIDDPFYMEDSEAEARLYAYAAGDR